MPTKTANTAVHPAVGRAIGRFRFLDDCYGSVGKLEVQEGNWNQHAWASSEIEFRVTSIGRRFENKI